MELHHNGSAGKHMCNSPALTRERVPTDIPRVWIEHLKRSEADVQCTAWRTSRCRDSGRV